MFPKIIGVITPKSSILIGIFHYKPSILGGFPPYIWFNTHFLELFFSAVGSENQRGRELEDEGESGVGFRVCVANAKASIMLETHEQ